MCTLIGQSLNPIQVLIFLKNPTEQVQVRTSLWKRLSQKKKESEKQNHFHTSVSFTSSVWHKQICTMCAFLLGGPLLIASHLTYLMDWPACLILATESISRRPRCSEGWRLVRDWVGSLLSPGGSRILQECIVFILKSVYTYWTHCCNYITN